MICTASQPKAMYTAEKNIDSQPKQMLLRRKNQLTTPNMFVQKHRLENTWFEKKNIDLNTHGLYTAEKKSALQPQHTMKNTFAQNMVTETTCQAGALRSPLF